MSGPKIIIFDKRETFWESFTKDAASFGFIALSV